MRDLMKFAEEAIDLAREVGKEKREQARGASMKEIERRQAGETERTGMTLASREKVAELDRAAREERKTVPAAEKGLSASQMASHRESAMKQAREQIDARRDFKGNIINPATNKPMTSAEETDFIKMTADGLLQYSLGGAVPGGAPAPEGRATVTTAGGQQFGAAGAGAPIARSTMTPSVAAPVAAPGVTTEEAGAVAAPVTPAGRRASAAERLRAEYEKKRQAEVPSLTGAIRRGVSGFAKRLTQRQTGAPAATPLGLRGYMENAYNR